MHQLSTTTVQDCYSEMLTFTTDLDCVVEIQVSKSLMCSRDSGSKTDLTSFNPDLDDTNVNVRRLNIHSCHFSSWHKKLILVFPFLNSTQNWVEEVCIWAMVFKNSYGKSKNVWFARWLAHDLGTAREMWSNHVAFNLNTWRYWHVPITRIPRMITTTTTNTGACYLLLSWNAVLATACVRALK
jgi:hypothetical protein